MILTHTSYQLVKHFDYPYLVIFVNYLGLQKCERMFKKDVLKASSSESTT